MKIVTCKAARAAGLKHYFTGKPCLRGHVTFRYVASGCCAECSRVGSCEWRARNLNAARAKSLRWARNNKERMRQNDWKRFGLPVPTRPEPLSCELCGKVTTRALDLDHDHSTGAFRGWLCKACNLGLGLLGDSAVSLRAALAYLEAAK